MDNISKINKIIKKLESDNENYTLEKVLEKYDWPPEIFFITLVSQIINELTNIENKAKEKDLINYNTSFLYKMINLFCNVKYHHAITKQILDYIITKENLDLIFDKIIIINNTKDSNNNKEIYEEFNNHIINLLITIMNFNNKEIIDIIVNNRNSNNLINDLFHFFSENDYCRNFLYNLVKNFIKYYPNVKSFKEKINYTIYYLIQYLNKNVDNYFKIKEEINIILLIYKNDIEIISDNLKILLMYLFKELEKSQENNFADSVANLIKNCFNNIVFLEKDKKNNISNINNKNEYNYKFANFLFSIYFELIQLKLEKSYTLLFSQLFLSLEQQLIGVKKYKWLSKNTHFKNVLNSIITLKDENLLSIYFTKIMTLSAPKNSKNKEDYYLADEDIYFFISNLENIIKDDNDNSEYILNIICSMIINLININKAVINNLFNKYKIIDIFLSLITCDKYNIKTRLKVTNLLEEILKLNNFYYQYELKITIEKDINDINKRLYFISLLYEKDIKKLEQKISCVITNMLQFLNNNNFDFFFSYNDIILEFIINKKFNRINSINNEITFKLNDIYVYASQKIFEHENKNENNNENGEKLDYLEIKKKFIKYLVKIIFELNMNNFKNKLDITRTENNKIIFSENTIFIAIKNILSGKTKTDILNYIISKICLDNKDNEINDNNNIINNNINDEKENNNNVFLIKSCKLIYILNIALFENNDEESIILLYNKLEEIINYSEINIKILLNFDIIFIMIKVLLQNDNKELTEKIKLILNKISKNLDEKSLIDFISKIYFISYDALINEGNSNIKKKETAIDLFNILKYGLINSKKTNCNYLSISNKKLSNPYIYNLFYITGLYKKNQIINYSVNIRINNNISNFYLASFINNTTSSIISFLIDDNNQLVISESQNKKEKKDIKIIKNINNYLKCDNNFHNISIILNFSLSTIKIFIDSNELKEENNKIIFNSNLLLNSIDVIIGYEFLDNKNKLYLSDISIIDISQILILNYDNEEDNDIINRQRLNINKGYDLLDVYIKDKNIVIGELISAEFNLKNNNINFIKSENIKNIKYFSQNILINKYIGNISYKNPFITRENNDNNNIINIFMISSNYNIEEYYSLNNIFSEKDISKNIIKSSISKNFDFSLNVCNYNFIDFLIGFLFISERKRKKLLNKEKEDNQNNKDNENKKNEIINDEKKENIEINENENDDNFIKDIIIIIFEIIIEIQNKDILNYFWNESDIINIKIKHFFERNIEIINNNQFIEKLFSIFKMTKMSDILELQNNNFQEYLLKIISRIFLQLIIFKNLKIEIQNLIILKLYSLLNTIISKNNNNLNYILYELLMNIYNIILFHELSNDCIEKDNNKTQLDILLHCIQKILNIYETEYKFLFLENNNNLYYKNIIEFNEDIINLNSEFESNIISHKVHDFVEQNKILLTDNFLENKLIKKQIEKLSKCINHNSIGNKGNERFSLDLARTSNINFNLNSPNENNIENINDKKCSFCLYLNIYFTIYFNYIYDDIKFDKYYKKFNRNLFLNFKGFRDITQNENGNGNGNNMFAWYLSSKESIYRIQNKFFLKENDIKIIQTVKGNNKGVFNSYLYDYDKNQYQKLIINFHKLFIYDNISTDSHFLTKMYDDINKKNIIYHESISENVFNCLYVKKIHKTLSLLLLNKEYILIFNNIFKDLNDNIQVVKTEPDKAIICLKKEKFTENFNNFVKNNNENIVNELFKGNVGNKNRKGITKFGLDKYYKFSVKKIYYKKISEMHKISHLQIDNSIEITTTNGENHFILFLSEQRDKIFNKILKYIGIEAEASKSKKQIKTSSIFLGKNTPKIYNSFYMKYCPTNYIENHEKEIMNLQKSTVEKTRTKSSNKDLIILSQNKKYTKSLVDLNSFVNEICDLWIKNKISNYDYLMALNCLAGRSLNDLTQYYIFPWILKDFDHNILNWFSSSLYRNLSLPLYSCELNLADLKRKFELQDINDKCHTGTFYSTSAFVCYFLTRQRPFTEIHLEIHGGQFDCADRLFIGTRELSVIYEKYQELIPALYNLAETYINTNNFKFGKMQNKNIEVKDFNLPSWTKEDPRKFVLILRKILESEKVNKKLHLWIDLVFGYKQTGNEAIKNYNLFRSACYESTPEEIEEKIKNNELQGYLYEKQELGYTAKKLFKKEHKKKENCEEYKEKENIFFDNSLKLMKMKIEEIKNQNYDNNKNKIKFKKINDIFIFYNLYVIEEHLNYNFKGGISSLKSIMNALNKMNKLPHFKKNPLKVKKKLNNHENKKNNFIILGNNCQFIGKKIDNVIKYHKKYIQIIDIKNCIYSCFYLNEISNISCLTTNEKGNKIYIGFENGNIFEYKIIKKSKKNDNIINPFIYLIQINPESLINENIFNLNLFSNLNITNNNERKNPNNYNYDTILLEKIPENNFNINNPHISEEIVLLKLNEEHDIIIACTIKNLIYIISINNNFKLMHIVDFLYEYPKKIKDIIPLTFSGDFLIYSSINVYLFNINGVPLCELNLLNKENSNISKIEYVTACFIYDVILFTAHEDGSIIIWKVKNKNVFDNYNERISYIFNDHNSKSFLSEYNYNYDLYYYENNNRNDFSNKKIIDEYELKRKFDIVSQVKIKETKKDPIIYMKLSKDMSYMLLFDAKMNIYILSDFDDYNSDNNYNNSEKRISVKKEKKQYCIWCKKLINNDYFRTTQIKSISNFDVNDIDFDNVFDHNRNNTDDLNLNVHSNSVDTDNINKKGTFLCEECKQKLVHTENYLYKY